jgi:hypothetical protein
MFEKPASTEVPIAALLARRRSGRAFDPERPVPREVLLPVRGGALGAFVLRR